MKKEREAGEQGKATNHDPQGPPEQIHPLKPSSQLKPGIDKLRRDKKSCQSQQVFFRRDGSLKMIYKNFREEKGVKKRKESCQERGGELHVPAGDRGLQEGNEKYDLREILNEIDPTMSKDLVSSLEQVLS